MAKPKRKVVEGGRPLRLLDEAEAHAIERVLGKDGIPDGTITDPDLDETTLRRLYETMFLVRAVDERGFKLQRSGRIKFWIPWRWLEGTHVAATMIYAPDDWVFMGYRHPGYMLLHGFPLQRLIYHFFGRVGELIKGHRTPWGERSGSRGCAHGRRRNVRLPRRRLVRQRTRGLMRLQLNRRINTGTRVINDSEGWLIRTSMRRFLVEIT